MFKTPILFLIFNRPDTTRQVFESIRTIKPLYLFIAADGPRNKEDKELCEQTRKIILDNINWNCEVKILFREKNLGCKLAVSSAIDWFFENVEQGIILEDDCLPNLTFFNFCEELLDKYKNDNRIWHITGYNTLDIYENNADYYFAKKMHCWGWASWKRAWKHYDVSMQDFPEFKKQNAIKNVFSDEKIQSYHMQTFENTFNNLIDTWDYQWIYTILKNNAMCINPSKNLISNIGFGSNATFCKDISNNNNNTKRYKIEKIRHPEFIIFDESAIQQINDKNLNSLEKIKYNNEPEISFFQYLKRYPFFFLRSKFWKEYVYKKYLINKII